MWPPPSRGSEPAAEEPTAPGASQERLASRWWSRLSFPVHRAGRFPLLRGHCLEPSPLAAMDLVHLTNLGDPGGLGKVGDLHNQVNRGPEMPVMKVRIRFISITPKKKDKLSIRAPQGTSSADILLKLLAAPRSPGPELEQLLSFSALSSRFAVTRKRWLSSARLAGLGWQGERC